MARAPLRSAADSQRTKSLPAISRIDAVTATLLLQQVLNGLLDGVYYLLIALGLSLIFSLGGIVNLAHGALLRHRRLSRPYRSRTYRLRRRACRRAGAGRRCSASLIERLLFRRFYRSDPILSLLLTFGLAHGRRAGPAHDFRRAAARPMRSRRSCAARSSSAISSIRAIARCMLASRCCCVAGLWVAAQPHRLRPRGARRRAEPGHGRRARHLAAALHDGGRGSRHRPGRPGRRAARADLFASIRRWARRSSRRHSSSW